MQRASHWGDLSSHTPTPSALPKVYFLNIGTQMRQGQGGIEKGKLRLSHG